MKKDFKSLITLLIIILIGVVICNILTPFLYRQVETDKTRTTFLLSTIQNKDFTPDVMVFGSSKSMYGIDCNQLTEETGLNCYNFSSTGQPQEESSLYYPLLPKSVKAVVQIVFPPIIDKVKVNNIKKQLNNSIVSSFYLSGYELSDDVIKINPYIDFSNMKENFFVQNYKSRGTIVIPALTNFLISRDKSDIYNLYYPNGALTDKHPMYNRTIEQSKDNYKSFNEIQIDTISCNTLKNYSNYFNSKGISYIVVLMPINPDLNKFTSEECYTISNYLKVEMPTVTICNYLDVINDNSYFYDAEHLNKKGAKIITTKLSEVINRLRIE